MNTFAFMCDDNNTLASGMRRMHTGPVGYSEQYIWNSQFVIVFFWITGWTKACLPWEKEQPVRLVESAHENLLKEVSGYCTRVHKRHARTRFRGPFKHSIQQRCTTECQNTQEIQAWMQTHGSWQRVWVKRFCYSLLKFMMHHLMCFSWNSQS